MFLPDGLSQNDTQGRDYAKSSPNDAAVRRYQADDGVRHAISDKLVLASDFLSATLRSYETRNPSPDAPETFLRSQDGCDLFPVQGRVRFSNLADGRRREPPLADK